MARHLENSRSAGAAQPSGRVRREVRGLVRRIGLERNPVRRPSDRLEAWCRVVVVLVALLAVPAAVGLGVRLGANLHADAARDAAARRAVAATVVAEPHVMAAPGRAGPLVVAEVAWTLPGHPQRVETAVVAPSARRGDPTTIWVTRDDELTSAPMNTSDADALAVLGAGAAYLGAAGSLVLLLAGLHWLLDRRRAREWAVDWAQFERAQRR